MHVEQQRKIGTQGRHLLHRTADVPTLSVSILKARAKITAPALPQANEIP